MEMISTTMRQMQSASDRILWVLQVEDNPAYARLVELMLEKDDQCRYCIVYVKTLNDALTKLYQRDFDVILLDLRLPDSEGLVTLERMCNAAPELPIILLTCSKEEEVSMQAVQFGAQDYLVKGEFDADLLKRTITYAIDRKESERDLVRLAQYDSLTSLANRHLFFDRLEQAVIRAKRNKSLLALLYIDLDLFKSINDNLGHDFGDILLQATAGRLQSCVRAQDTVARLGGDEFTVILENVSDERAVTVIAQKIVSAISEPLQEKDHEIFTTASVGITIFAGDEDLDAKHLIKQADTAMYWVKQQGRDKFLFFDESMDKATKSRVTIEKELRYALSREQLELKYQPLFNVQTGKLAGAEALLRWNHPKFGGCSASDFIPILEHMGLIVQVGEWVLHTACEQWETWRLGGNIDAGCAISVNFSARQFWQRDLQDMVLRTLLDTGLPAAQLDLGLTEGLLLKNDEGNIEILRALHDMGVKLTIDDFGTGFSSLADLKNFPINSLKVDHSFVKDILGNKQDIAIASAIINLARDLNLQVSAEGVDSREKVDVLHAKGCSIFQGNYFSEPLAATDFATKFLISTNGNLHGASAWLPL